MDICHLVEKYLDVAAKCGLADREKDWEAKREYDRQIYQLGLLMQEFCVKLKEVEQSVIPLYHATKDINLLYFFHVLVEDKPWKKVDMRGNIWSDWT